MSTLEFGSEEYKYAESYAGWAEAFSIFYKYDGGYAHVSAEHDEIYAGPTLANEEDLEDLEQDHEALIFMDPKDLARLEELGWEYDKDLECFSKFV